jgi:hypothetical protein
MTLKFVCISQYLSKMQTEICFNKKIKLSLLLLDTLGLLFNMFRDR